jgi:hypothetical protein
MAIAGSDISFVFVPEDPEYFGLRYFGRGFFGKHYWGISQRDLVPYVMEVSSGAATIFPVGGGIDLIWTTDDWLLSGGIWNDLSKWDDSAFWEDS